MTPHGQFPPVVYVPRPLPPADPLDFSAPPAPRPRRRPDLERGGTRGLLIALVVLAAVGLGWLGYTAVRAEWDKARAQEIPREMRAEIGRLEQVIGPDPAWEVLTAGRDVTADEMLRRRDRRAAERERLRRTPAAERIDARMAALAREYAAIAARHPEWRLPPLPW